MNVPIFAILFFSVMISIHIVFKKNSGGYQNKFYEYLEKEHKANLTIKRHLSKEIFVTPDINILPIKEYKNTDEYKKVISAQTNVLNKSKLKMIHFTQPINNTELKLKYGVNNLDNITMYEEHYNLYIRALIDWAKALVDIKNTSDAEIILKEAINFGSDLSINYTLLADIYSNENNKEKLKKFREEIKNSNLKMKNKILLYIDNIK